METLGSCFELPVYERKHGTQTYWCLEMSSLKKMKAVIEYFDRFPLLSSKFLEYQDWKHVYVLLCQHQHLNDAGKAKILALKHGMNRNRRFFDWTHLPAEGFDG